MWFVMGGDGPSTGAPVLHDDTDRSVAPAHSHRYVGRAGVFGRIGQRLRDDPGRSVQRPDRDIRKVAFNRDTSVESPARDDFVDERRERPRLDRSGCGFVPKCKEDLTYPPQVAGDRLLDLLE